MRVRRGPLVLWSAAVTVLLLLIVKFFVADVYRIDSGSMRPTLFGGPGPDGEEDVAECVLVAYDRSPAPERFDAVVMRSRDGGNPIVKRVVGLPGETVSIADGDLLVEGERLPLETPRPAPVTVFDDKLLDVTSHFQFHEELWTHRDTEWVVDARSVSTAADAGGSNAGMMFFHKELRDGYLDPSLRRVPGLIQVNDGILECMVRMEPPGPDATARLRFELVEEGDTFQAAIVQDGSGFRVQLTRRNAETQRRGHGRAEDLLVDRPLAFETGRAYRVKFSNVDNHLAFVLDGERIASADYEANVPYPGFTGTVDKSLAPRVAFGAEGCRASFSSIVILRDLFYTSSGEHAVSSFLSLGPGEYFLMGDNSAESSDSRHFGPVHVSEIVGRPIAVVWPLSRVRWVPGAEEP